MKKFIYIPGIVLLFSPPLWADAPPRLTAEQWGDKIQILLPTVGLAASMLYEDKSFHYQGMHQWMKAFITFEVVVEALKLTTHKERPNRRGYESFPSGHTAASFMGASFIHQRYGLGYAIPAYISAAFVGYTRVHAKKHYGEDVLAGAVIGLTSTLMFTTPYKGIKVMPLVSKGALGLCMSTQW